MTIAHARSNRTGQPDIEVLAPMRADRFAAAPASEAIEDAEFEVIQAAADADVADFLASGRPAHAVNETVAAMRAHLGRERAGPERLGLFSGDASAAAPSPSPVRQFYAPAALVIAAFVGGTVFWMAGGHSLFTSPRAADPVTTASIPRAQPAEREAAARDAVAVRQGGEATVASPFSADAGAVQVIRPPQRPARIERAGSILMIRTKQ